MKCYYCGRSFGKKDHAITHLEKAHSNQLAKDGLDPAQACYLTTHTSLQGRCTCSPNCTEKTEWNYKTGKPYRISPKPECRARNTERAQRNLMNARGIDQHTLMSDMEHQKDMRRHKHTSGVYRFNTDGGKVEYESQLDKNFLIFCDRILELPSFTIMDPPESFPYMDTKENVQRWYTPDYYMPDYNLLIEIKEGGNHPNTNPAYIKETKYKVAMKDEAMKKQNKYNFIRISGANYGPFIEMLYNIVHQDVDSVKPKHALVVITENACIDPEEQYEFGVEDESINTDNIRLIVGYMEHTTSSMFIGITDSTTLASWLLYDYEETTIRHATYQDPIFQSCGKYRIYKYIGSKEEMEAAFKMIEGYVSVDGSSMGILEILSGHGIYFDDGLELSNNEERRSDFIMIEEGQNDVSGIQDTI